MTTGFQFEPTLSLGEREISTLLEGLGSNYTRVQGDNVQSDHCFLHGNSSATLGVSINAPHAWNCFSCGQKGKEIVSLICAAMRVDRQGALTYLYTLFPDLLQHQGKAVFQVYTEDAARPRFVLSKNSLSAYPLDQDNRIGYRAVRYPRKPHNKPLCTEAQADEYRLGYDLKHHRLVFPVFHQDGELAGMIGRCMLPSCPKDYRWFNYDEANFKKARCVMGCHTPIVMDKPIVVVEGPTDFIIMKSLGVPNVMALMGAEYSDFQFDLIASYRLPVVPLFDHDKAGINALYKFRAHAKKTRLRILPFRYPDSCFVDGKADPGSLTEESVGELVKSFGNLFSLS